MIPYWCDNDSQRVVLCCCHAMFLMCWCLRPSLDVSLCFKPISLVCWSQINEQRNCNKIPMAVLCAWSQWWALDVVDAWGHGSLPLLLRWWLQLWLWIPPSGLGLEARLKPFVIVKLLSASGHSFWFYVCSIATFEPVGIARAVSLSRSTHLMFPLLVQSSALHAVSKMCLIVFKDRFHYWWHECCGFMNADECCGLLLAVDVVMRHVGCWSADNGCCVAIAIDL